MNVSTGPAAVYDVIPQLRRLREEMLYSDVWLQPDDPSATGKPRGRLRPSDARPRSELRFHIGKARENGLTLNKMRGSRFR